MTPASLSANFNTFLLSFLTCSAVLKAGLIWNPKSKTWNTAPSFCEDRLSASVKEFAAYLIYVFQVFSNPFFLRKDG